jgi:hypothetical protein
MANCSGRSDFAGGGHFLCHVGAASGHCRSDADCSVSVQVRADAIIAANVFPLLQLLSRPAGNIRGHAFSLMMAPLLLAGAIITELLVVPSPQWMPRAIGTKSILCVTFIPGSAHLPFF